MELNGGMWKIYIKSDDLSWKLRMVITRDRIQTRGSFIVYDDGRTWQKRKETENSGISSFKQKINYVKLCQPDSTF